MRNATICDLYTWKNQLSCSKPLQGIAGKMVRQILRDETVSKYKILGDHKLEGRMRDTSINSK